MINIYKEGLNNIVIHYNTMGGVKRLVKKHKPFKVVKDTDGDYVDLAGERYKKGFGTYAYNCMSNNNYSLFLNTCLDLTDDFINNLVAPSLVFYDIETNEYAVPEVEDKKIFKHNSKAIITSIAWVNYQTKETKCLVNGVDGDERFIIKSFLDYCKDNNIIGIAGFNNFFFDDIVMSARAKHYNFKNMNILFSDCNIDVMKLSKAFNYSSREYISLNNLASVLNINEGKVETGVFNPINLYQEALNDKSKLDLLIEYNIQDVNLTISCFDKMACMDTLIELFKQSKCPFNKITGKPTYMLNSYVCNKAYKENIVIPEVKEITNNIKFGGGFNYHKESSGLKVYDNIGVFDVVSFYPNLMRILKIDPFYDYPNIDKNTGAISKFDDNIPDGYIGKVAGELFESRVETKNLMKQYNKDTDEYNRLDKIQLTKKILVNALFGALSKEFFVLNHSYMSKIITAIGRDILINIINKFGGVYGKTDSVFIPVDKNKSSSLLEKINTFITNYLKEKYNLKNDLSDGSTLIKMEVDSYLNKFIIKDKNNYVKIINDKVILKGGSFINDEFSRLENNLIQEVIKLILNNKSDNDITTHILDYVKKVLNNIPDVSYYAKPYNLGKKRADHQKALGRKYMDDNNIPYSWSFKYYCCKVANNDYDFVLYPLNYKPSDLVINKAYVYKLASNVLKNLKIIDDNKCNELIKMYEKHYPKIAKGQTTLTGFYNDAKIFDDLDSFDFIDSEKVKCNILLDMQETIKDTFDCINKDLLKFLIVNANTKKAILPKGFHYNNNSSSLNQNNFIYPKQNIGLIHGYNNIKDYNNRIAILDIDGAKNIVDDETNKRLKDYLYNILKTIDYPFIVWKSSSKTGYHLAYVTNSKDKYNLSHIFYPDDFFIPELAGKSLGMGTIEVLEKQNGFVKLPSDFKNHLISENNSWSQLFNNPINIHHAIDNAFKKYGFKVGVYDYSIVTSSYHQEGKETIILSSDDLIILSDCISQLFVIAEKQNLLKSDVALAIGGWLCKHINYDNLDELLNMIIKKSVIDNKCIFKSNHQFKKIITNSYNRNNINKKGLPSLIRMFHYERDKIKYLINKIVDVNNKAYYKQLPITHLKEVMV